MKALANGAINLSILDGWWDEAWRAAAAGNRFVGWAIGRGESYDNAEYQDQVESAALYDLLEHDIVPAFYDRAVDGVPRRWIANMKGSISGLCPSFNMQRVVKQYAGSYVTAHERYQRLTAEKSARAKALAAWVLRIRANWAQVRVERIAALAAKELSVGSQIQVRAWIRLGPISADEVLVELYLGRLDSGGEITDGVAIPMQPAGQSPEGLGIFEAAAVPCGRSGLHGYTVRVLPFHADEAKAFLPGIITWADGK
jgi:starch phosphorylase